MKKLITCLTAGLLVVGAQSLLAQSATNSVTTPATPAHQGHKGMTPEQRKELMQDLGLTRADLKGLSPEDRRAKMKETAEKVVAELKAKQTSGALGTDDQAKLDLIEKFLAHGPKKAQAPAQ